MYKNYIFTIIGTVLFYTGFAQNNSSLQGYISCDQGDYLSGASVYLKEIKRGVVSDENGFYRIENLAEGRYTLITSFLGYETHETSVYVSGKSTHNEVLEYSLQSLQEVTVHDHAAENEKREKAVAVDIVNEEFLRNNLGGSLVKSLERLPGVSSMDIGSGQSKPVIRGLGFNRVVVVENGIKHEGQQWGADHGLEIDQYAVDKIEVIKGPASLMYGSDAVGGVIDAKFANIPFNNTYEASADIFAKSNNDLLGGSFSFATRKNKLYLSFRATVTDYADYKVPADTVDVYSYRIALTDNRMRNTAGDEKNIHFAIGFIGDNFSNKTYVSSVNSRSGFFANAHGMEPRNVNSKEHDKSFRDVLMPYQSVNHFKVINKTNYNVGVVRAELDLGYQNNLRREWSQYVSHGYMPPVFPDTLSFPENLEREFDKDIYSARLNVKHDFNSNTQFVFGLSNDFHRNNIDGRGFIIPAYMQNNSGAFVFAKRNFNERLILSGGLRYDYSSIDIKSYSDWFQSPQITGSDTVYVNLERAKALRRNFSNLSWSFGLNYNRNEYSVKANIAKSFRVPIAKELSANGVNYHNFSYEVGNPDLKPEIAYQFDLGLEYQDSKLAIGATPFINYFSNFIYLNPSYEHDRLYGNGNQIFYYTETELLRFGAEIHAHYELFKGLTAGFIGEYVYSEQLSGDKKGFTIPFSPPASAIINLKYNKDKLAFLSKFFVSADYRLTAAQNNIVPPEDPSDAYSYLNLSLGSALDVFNQEVKISFQTQNVFNTKYFNHMSYYRRINVPEAGRNFILNISVPFSGKI